MHQITPPTPVPKPVLRVEKAMVHVQPITSACTAGYDGCGTEVSTSRAFNGAREKHMVQQIMVPLQQAIMPVHQISVLGRRMVAPVRQKQEPVQQNTAPMQQNKLPVLQHIVPAQIPL